MTNTDKQNTTPGIILNAENIAGSGDTLRETLEKYDAESRYRRPGKNWSLIIKIIAIAFSLFQFYTAGFGILPAQIQRPMHIFFVFVLIFLLYPATSKGRKDRMNYIDVLLAVIAGSTMLYLVINYREIMYRGGIPTELDIIFGAMAIIFTLDAARRVGGLSLHNKQDGSEDTSTQRYQKQRHSV